MCAPTGVPDVLAKILERKKDEVDELKSQLTGDSDHPISKALVETTDRNKAFYNALNTRKGTLTVIAEIKRKSPSKGLIGKISDAGILSRVYYEGGAGAISVLTDVEGFGGTMEDLKTVVQTQKRFKGNYPGPCPVLRKDFIIDEIQIAEAAVGGASAVLLIVAALGKDRTKELLKATHRMGLDALVEVHDEEELKIALDIGADIVGINNRNLRDFNVSLETSFRLAPLIPDGVVKVAESGISTCSDAWELRDAGFNAILVGETLVKAYEGSSANSTGYAAGYNQAKGYIKAFKSKGSTVFGSNSIAPFFGKGEGAKETLGEISI
ncbi:indole-3-glycerol phosphate synthase [Gracilaria domingensis]|nr:indole-3-glycerol phosphate synthase [Gracilaria domingensis]